MVCIIKFLYEIELQNELWGGALDTLKVIIENDKLQNLMNLLIVTYPKPVDITTINDLLWFESDFIYEQIGIEVDDE